MLARGLFVLACIQFLFPLLTGFVLTVAHAKFGFSHNVVTHYLSTPLIALSELVMLVVASVASAVMISSERQDARFSFQSRLQFRTNLSDGKPSLIRLLIGALSGTIMLSLVVGFLMLSGNLHLAPVAQSGTELLYGQLGLLGTFALVGFAEEFATRGYALRALRDAIGFWAATIVTSTFFALGHYLEGDTIAGAAGIFEGAVFECLAIRLTGTLAFSIGFHSAWDFFESAIYGVPNSSFLFKGAALHTSVTGQAWLTGGIAGPEGSAPRFVVYAIAILILLRLQRGLKLRTHNQYLTRFD